MEDSMNKFNFYMSAVVSGLVVAAVFYLLIL
jgi:hypothetical protein